MSAAFKIVCLTKKTHSLVECTVSDLAKAVFLRRPVIGQLDPGLFRAGFLGVVQGVRNDVVSCTVY
jgi:hypothetical protein